MCTLRAHIKLSIFRNIFSGIEKVYFFNSREIFFPKMKINVCPKGTH